MKHLISVFFGLVVVNLSFSQLQSYTDTLAVKYASTITSDELREAIYFLAGDSCAGRETGQHGQKVAAAYIARLFKNLSLPPVVNGSYFQSFPIEPILKSEVIIKHNNLQVASDGIFFLNGFKTVSISINEAVFAGYGIHSPALNSYDGIQVNNKAVFLMDGKPVKNGKSVAIPGDIFSEWADNFKIKVTIAKKNGASVVFSIIPDNQFNITIQNIADFAAEYDMELNFNPNHIPYLFISESVAKKWLNFNGQFNDKSPQNFLNLYLTLEFKTNLDTLYGENVLGYIEGTDLKHEIVVITAHYDHLGIHHGKTYYGADDDGSGTAAILEIAEAFSEACNEGNSPRRSVLIMPVSGEEKGLLGSAYYTNNPIFPLQNTIVNLNIDMIGRIDANHTGNSNYVYLIGSDKLSTDLHIISENTNSTYTKLELDYTYNDPNDPNMFYYRSDHYNFAKNNIPVIFYFTGVHEDYHKPTDTPDKLDYKKIEKITQLVFYTAWDLANREMRPVVDKKNDFKNK